MTEVTCVVRGDVYKLTLINRIGSSSCNGCAFYTDEDGCETAGMGCVIPFYEDFSKNEDFSKTHVWVKHED